MSLIIGLLTFILVVTCLLLILLILIQLPKKDAGMGMAFGGAATDALFGAGSGSVLTKITKYAAITFFVLSFAVALLHQHAARSGGREFDETSKKIATQFVPPPPAPPKPGVTPVVATNTNAAPVLMTNLVTPKPVLLPVTTPAVPAVTNAAPKPATNAPAK